MKILFFIIVLAAATICYGDFISDVLSAHNNERALLNIPDLTWSEDLAESALRWASKLARRNSLKQSDRRRSIGESIGRKRTSPSYDSVAEILNDWISEKENYVHRKYPRCSITGDRDDVEHYTQMIWEETTEVGCGMASGFGRDYLVCQYKTAGNRNGKYAYTEDREPEEDETDAVEEEPTVIGTVTQPQVNLTQPQVNVTQPIIKSDEIITEVKTDQITTEVKDAAGHTTSIKTQSETVESKTEIETFEDTPETDPFIAECLKAHNDERTPLGAPKLVWAEDLAESALSWAKTLASRGSLKHSSGRNKIGENIAYTGTKKNSVARLLEMWTSEKRYYVHRPYPNCSSTGNKSDVGHYTQVIWKDTTELGCGLATKSGKDFMVCQYRTSGNRQGKYAY